MNPSGIAAHKMIGYIRHELGVPGSAAELHALLGHVYCVPHMVIPAASRASPWVQFVSRPPGLSHHDFKWCNVTPSMVMTPASLTAASRIH